MPNEFIIKNGYRSQGNSEITGSLNVTAGITGSLSGTATSASFAATASFLIGGVTIDTGSLVTTSSFNAYTGSNSSQFAGTASLAVSASFLIGGVTVTEYIRRSDYTGSLDPNINYLYCGQAPSGSAESAPGWDISRLAISASGDTITQSASNAAWTDRYITIYS
jgi:hypothetical protein